MLNCYPVKFPSLTDDLHQKLLDFANAVPLELGNDAIKVLREPDFKAWERYHIQSATTSAAYNSYALSEELHQQLADETGILKTVPPMKHNKFYMQKITKGNAFCPHYDPPWTRTYVLLYNLSLEDNGITSFYNQTIPDTDRIVFALDEIELIETFQLQPRRWYLFNNQTLHGVTNMSSTRIGITIGIDPIRYDDFYNYFKNTLIDQH